MPLRWFLPVLLGLTLWAWWCRWDQSSAWRERLDEFTVDGRPMMGTADAYKWLRYADEIRQGTYRPGQADPLMAYPDGLPRPRPAPLLSVLLAHLSSPGNGALERTGLVLVPILAVMFIVPLGLLLWRAGYPAAAVLAGFVGSGCEVYFVRTSAGRVDTDALILFFPLVASCLVLEAALRRPGWRTVACAGGAGLAMAAFHWWYDHPGFSVVYLVTLIVSLAVHRVAWRPALLAAIAFVVCANPVWVAEGLGNLASFIAVYLSRSPPGPGLPDVYATIDEARPLGAWAVLGLVVANRWIALGGLALFVLFVIVHPRMVLPILPLVGLGLLAFVSANRFALFLAPWAGAGLGYGLTLALDGMVFRKWSNRRLRSGITLAGAVISCAMLVRWTSVQVEPRPYPSAELATELLNLRRGTEPDAVVLGWWDLGLAIEHLAGRATFHDGMCQGRARTYLIARALFSPSQQELHGTTTFIAARGDAGIGEVLATSPSTEAAVARIAAHDGSAGDRPLYLVFTRDMLGVSGAIEWLGRWDLVEGRARRAAFVNLSCQLLPDPGPDCPPIEVDMERGWASDGRPLRFAVVSDGGTVVTTRTFRRGTGWYYLELVDREVVVGRFLMDRETFHTNLIQMFVLGLYDGTLFEEVHDGFPILRSFRVVPQ